MTQPLLRDSSGWYELPSRNWRGPSVTTVLGATLAKPALLQWYANEAAEAACKLAESYDASAGPCGEYFRMLQRDIAGVPRKTSRDAAHRGVGVHEILARLGEGRDVAESTVPARLLPYLKACLAFTREGTVRPLWSERTIYHVNAGYAGTMDAIWEIGGVVTLLDLKTKPSEDRAKVWPENRLQLAAYRYAQFALREDGVEVGLPRIKQCAVLLLWPDGYRLEIVKAGRAEFDVFKALLRVYAWLNGAV